MRSEVLLLSMLSVWGVTESALSPEKLQNATTSFSLELFKELAKGEAKNLIVSPLSVSTVLAMLLQGARGSTANRLETAIHLDSNQAKEAYSDLSKHYQADSLPNNTTLEIANHLFVGQGFPINPEFKSVLEESFLSDVDLVDFTSTEAIRIINDWASKATHGKIKTIVDESLSPDTVLILANAIYFRANWDIQFNNDLTFDQEFTVKPGKTVKVPFMTDRRELTSSEHNRLNAKYALLPFEGKQFSLLIVLPNEKNGLANLISKLSVSDISEMIATNTVQLTEFQMPRFKLASKHILNEPLQQLGLAELFGNANFSGVSSSGPPLVVSRVIQKATIEIDEKGGVAAAVTGVEVGIVSIDDSYVEPFYFVADHPFLAAIVDNKKKIPLFMTTVVNPSSSQ